MTWSTFVKQRTERERRREKFAKYEFTGETKTVHGKTVKRIRALRELNIPVPYGVHKIYPGDIGGFIESEKNLVQDGDAWVSDEAVVMDNARLYNDAHVSGYAIVSGNAKIVDTGYVSDHATVSGNAIVRYTGWVRGNATISGEAEIADGCVEGNAVIKGDGKVYGNATVYGNAVVDGCILGGGTEVWDNAHIGNPTDKCLIITGESRIFGNAEILAKVKPDVWIGGNAKVEERNHSIKVEKLGDLEDITFYKTANDSVEFCTFYTDRSGYARRMVFSISELARVSSLGDEAKEFEERISRKLGIA